MTATIIYQGELRCSAEHLQSSTIIETDAPTDNRGKGERFSPTDLLCVALGTCMITTMGIRAMDMQVNLSGAKLSVSKHMANSPRRVSKVEITLQLPGNNISEHDRKVLEQIGDGCPVARSLHPDVEIIADYQWV